eukprot:m51a1_g13322 putative rna-binding region rnp-1 domain-containing protein (116) ;mRNA; f:560-1031
MFTPAEALSDPNFVTELRSDIEAEASKCGEVQKVTIFERNPEGVVVVVFKDMQAAESCIRLMDGRFFAGQRVNAFFYDGKTDYQVLESEEEKQKRIANWEKYLNESNETDAKAPQ